jgi:uncharacterized protein YjiS (DUF1127 family)
MRKENKLLASNLDRALKQAAVWAVAAVRLLARCISCYIQLHREYDELARLSYRSLREIGLSPHDVSAITGRPIWPRCWQSVRSCSNKRCRGSSLCIAECRRTETHFFDPKQS